jgi:C4-dicarboxylate-binding protein DctP
LARGDLDMAVPGLWQLDKVEANAILTTLPTFAGLSPEQLTRLVDGPVAADLNKRLESKLRVHVPGRYLALGYAHTYSAAKPIRAMDDLRGMKVRIPGGAAILALYKSRGANPVVIPWADVPLALSQGTIDALQSSDETIRSGKMWDAGLKHAFADGGVFLHYVPMVAKPTWDKLGPGLQKVVTEAWESIVDPQRRLAEQRQAEAREENRRNGINYVIPSEAELQKARLAAAAQTDEVVKSMELDPELLRRARAAVGLGS